MSELLKNSLNVASRAKFSGIRAGIETLLDVGDIEAALYKLQNTETDTEQEEAVKTTLISELNKFQS